MIYYTFCEQPVQLLYACPTINMLWNCPKNPRIWWGTLPKMQSESASILHIMQNES